MQGNILVAHLCCSAQLARLDTCVTVVDASNLLDNMLSLQTLKVELNILCLLCLPSFTLLPYIFYYADRQGQKSLIL